MLRGQSQHTRAGLSPQPASLAEQFSQLLTSRFLCFSLFALPTGWRFGRIEPRRIASILMLMQGLPLPIRVILVPGCILLPACHNACNACRTRVHVDAHVGLPLGHGPFKHVVYQRRSEDQAFSAKSAWHSGNDVLQIVIEVPDNDSNQVHDRTGSENHGKNQQHPGEVRRIEEKKAHEVHSMVISSRPDVDHHESERVAEEEHRRKRSDYQHQGSPKQDHREHIARLSSERSFLQPSTVPYEEVHMEDEVQAGHSKEKEVRENPPNLHFFPN
mmetsp:Transcript_37313/g.74759  ORF Transcript_37313/g.74759 Transcript_37313/m.74759 type:complete len:273 (-) Transcript_37313:206-1024(-)